MWLRLIWIHPEVELHNKIPQALHRSSPWLLQCLDVKSANDKKEMNVTSRGKPNNSVLIGNFFISLRPKVEKKSRLVFCLQRVTKKGGLHQRLNLHRASCKKKKKKEKNPNPYHLVSEGGGNYIYAFMAELQRAKSKE